MMISGEALKFYRKQSKMTQSEVAAALEVSRQAISKWEVGTDIPSTKNLIALSKLFQIPLELLVNGDAEAVSGDPRENAQESAQPPEQAEKKKVSPGTLLLALCALIAAIAACIGIYVMNGKIDSLMPADTAVPMEEIEGEEADMPEKGQIDLKMP